MLDGTVVAGRACHGNCADHCCYIEGKECPFLEIDTVPGRHFVCGLRRELGSWDAVHADPRYLAIVRPAWDRNGVVDCGEFAGFNRAGEGQLQCCFTEMPAGSAEAGQLPDTGPDRTTTAYTGA